MNNLYFLKAKPLITRMFFLILIYEPCYAYKTPKIWNLSNENVFFIGREEQLQAIKTFFKKSKRDILALTGGPGFGKTQVAKKYAHQFRKDYTLIWWIDVQQDVPNQFKKLAIALNHILSDKEKIVPSTLSEEVLVDRVKDILRRKNVTYLLIFDNAESYDQIKKYIPSTYQQPGKHVLLTSRYANIWTDKIEIGKFKRSDSICFVKNNLPKEKAKNVEKLAESLCDYPLGLTLAIGFIKSSPITTINKYLSMHMKRTLKHSEDPPSAILDSYTNNAQMALEISLKSIEENSKDALETLFFMSLLNSKDIPETYIDLWLKQIKSSLTADEAVKYIYAQSLVDVSETREFNTNEKSEEQERMHYLSIHDLIHQLINERISTEEKRKLIDNATVVMLEIFSGPSEIFTTKVTKEPIHLLHAQQLCENAREIEYSTPNLLQLKVCIFECLTAGLRNFKEAKLVLEEIENDLQNNLQLSPYYKALFEINKGFLESMYNVNYDACIHHMKEALSILNSLEGYSEERVRAISNLAQAHIMRGEADLAANFINEGKSIFEKSHSGIYNCLFLFAWAVVLNDEGKFQDSIEILEKTKAYPMLSEEYPTLNHAVLYQKAEAFIKLGQLDIAWKLLTECEKKVKEFFRGKNNMALANILVNKSLISIYKKNSSSKVFQNLAAALEIYENSFQGTQKHRNQGRAHLVIGKAHALGNNFENALKEYLISNEIYGNVLKDKKIDDVSELYKELAILGTDMKDEELAYKYLKAHTKTFGLDHPRTKEIFHYLDALNPISS